MKLNQWTVGLAAAGVISLASAVNAEEATSQVLTALSSTTLSGYVDTSAIWKFGTGNALPGRAYDGPGKQDGFNLNVVKVSLEKPLTEDKWSAGYKIDFLAGPDSNTFGSHLKQAYVALRVPVGNGLDLKLGVWDTIIGYEVFDAGNNPNYSRSFGYLLEPTTYTGLQASYKLADWISVTAAVADPGTNPNPGAAVPVNSRSQIESVKSYMASVVLTAPESWGSLKGAALYAGIVDHGKVAAAGVDTQNFYVGFTTPTGLEGLSVGAAYDYQGFSHRGTTSPSGYANAASFYTTYKHDKWSFNNRFEYATSGNSYNPFGFGGGGAYYPYPGYEESSIRVASAAGAGMPNRHPQLIGETFTVDYSLWANVISRLEFRWDHDLRGGPVGPYATDHYPLGQKNAVSLALNVIYKF